MWPLILRPEKPKLWGKLASMVYFHVGGVVYDNFCFAVCLEKLPKMPFLEPLLGTFMAFFAIFLTPWKPKIVLQYSPRHENKP